MDLPAQRPAATVDYRRYLLAVWRRKGLALGIFVAVFGLVAVHTLREPKVYSATASMIIDSSEPRFLADQQQEEVLNTGSGTFWFNKEYYETQYKVILSRAVSQRVVDRLGLATDAGFLGLEHLTDPKAREAAMKNLDAVALLQSKISVIAVKDSRVVDIIVEDRKPDRAALLANEVATAYIDETLALKLKVTENASRWLEDRLDELEQTTKKSELALYDFQKKSDMLTDSLEDKANLLTQQLTHYNDSLTQTRTQLAQLRAHVDAIRKLEGEAAGKDPLWAEGIPGLGADMLEDLRMSYVKQRADCVELGQRYGAEHPQRVACEEKLGALKQDLVRELANVVHKAQVELTEVTEREKNLSALYEGAKAEAFEASRRQIEFEQLKRDAANNERLYDMVLKRTKDLDLSGLLRTSNARVLDPARPVPAPVKPRVPAALLLGALLGLFCAGGLAIALELLDDSVSTQLDVEERLGLAFLGMIPRMAKLAEPAARDLEVHRSPRSTTAESCRAIRTNLLFMSPDTPSRTLLVTSSGPQEGKSTSVVNLGITMAQSGNRVLLVDTDMRRPRLHRSFGIANERGLSSVIVGDATLEAVVRTTEVPNLFVVPCGPLPPNPAEVLHTRVFREFLAEAAKRYDRVILDSSPVNAVADALVLAAQVDGTLVVLKAGSTGRGEAERMVRALRDVKARVFGAILNDVDLQDPKYGGYFGNYYYPAYRGGAPASEPSA